MDERFREDAYAYLQHLGIRMVEWREDYARFELPIAPHLGNRHGNPHGGAHASLIDTVMGYAGCWTGAPGVVQHALTLSLNVQYLSRPRGEVMIGEGWRTGGGRSTFFAEARVSDETGEIIATGSGVFRYRGRG
ncbi:PaaI family thioesterase [Roseivivax sp. CAU 1761]